VAGIRLQLELSWAAPGKGTSTKEQYNSDPPIRVGAAHDAVVGLDLGRVEGGDRAQRIEAHDEVLPDARVQVPQLELAPELEQQRALHNNNNNHTHVCFEALAYTRGGRGW
jgi:hypothetical protein